MQASLFGSTVGAAQVGDVPISAGPVTGANIFSEAVVLKVRFSVFGSTRKLEDSEYDVDASKTKTRASKRICESKELAAIRSYDGKTRKAIDALTIPSPFEGFYLIRLSSVQVCEHMLQARMIERQTLVDEFMSKYDQFKHLDSLPADQGGLGSTYHEADYPAADDVRAKFTMTRQFIEFSAPGQLSKFSPELFEAQQAELRAAFSNAIEVGTQLLQDEFSGLVDHLVERLSPSQDGKPKKIKTTDGRNVLTALQEFASNFDARNFGGAEQLKSLVKQAQDIISGVGLDQVKKSDNLRESIRSRMEQVKSSLDQLQVVDTPTRKISLSDDDWGADL